MSVIELRSLSKWYGEVIGLNNISVALESGLITGLVGPNGAGKSTLMGLIMGQLHPSQGQIRVFGEDPWNRPRVLSQIGYCPEGDPFWPNLTGFQFVRFLAQTSGLSGHEAQAAAVHAIELTGMTDRMHDPIKNYSKGMRQRIKLSQALAHRPRLLILDEPFTAIDKDGVTALETQLEHHLQGGGAVIMSSHQALQVAYPITRLRLGAGVIP